MESLNDKTLGIVLTTVQINDHSQLVHLYTQTSGRVTCRIPLISRGKKASRMRNMMTPMTVLELVIGGRPKEQIRTIVEAHILQSPYTLAAAHPEKSAQCLFMAELIAHTIREEEANHRLWDYLAGSLEVLEHAEEGWSNFHLVFTCGLISQLGFCIDTEEYSEGCCFDLKEGVFTLHPIAHAYYLNPESSKWFCRIFNTQFDTMSALCFTHRQRSALLDMLLYFLSLQIPEMGQLRSVDVLKTMFS